MIIQKLILNLTIELIKNQRQQLIEKEARIKYLEGFLRGKSY